MTQPASRRGFLRGLAGLPLIGGGVSIIGAPTAAAVPLTGGMMATYVAWLHQEMRLVQYAQGWRGIVPCLNPAESWLWPRPGTVDLAIQGARGRAPVILSTAGVPLTSAEADASWGGPLA